MPFSFRKVLPTIIREAEQDECMGGSSLNTIIQVGIVVYKDIQNIVMQVLLEPTVIQTTIVPAP